LTSQTKDTAHAQHDGRLHGRLMVKFDSCNNL